MHRWFKFKEGFSAKLVQMLIEEFNLQPPQHILDPFAGVSTTLLVAREYGLDATGIEVMPIGEIIWRAKSQLDKYDVDQLQAIREWVNSTTPGKSRLHFPHLPITQFAFDKQHEAQLMWYDERFQQMDIADNIKALLKFVLLSILEDISYTSKDGQFLRWDSRSGKVRQRNAKRIAAGKAPYKPFHKRAILSPKRAIMQALDLIILDISMTISPADSNVKQELIVGSVLEALPRQGSNTVDAVITSPPYCNRYDYTRTYALELAFLGVDQEAMLELRQSQLSCTVENRSKLRQLRNFYKQIGRVEDFQYVIDTLEDHAAVQEVLGALRQRNKRGEVNNSGVIAMVEGYFIELAFVIFELSRVCKTGANIAMVNDNVRYSGETIPVDLLLTDIALKFGFNPERIYVLSQRKGNSSQQMGKYGREALRKSILIWSKLGETNAV